MLSFQTVEPHTLELLKKLSAEPFLRETRLVGGTALALQYGHRKSIDLDFFGTIEEDKEEIKKRLKRLGPLKVLSEQRNIFVYFLDNIKIDFVNYNYDWIDKPVTDFDLTLASPKDIAAMKVNAIEGRGSRKDFVDLYFLLNNFTLKQILDFYKEKYKITSVLRALMSLNYFDDAESQSMPEMIQPVSWNEIKDRIHRCVTEHSKEL